MRIPTPTEVVFDRRRRRHHAASAYVYTCVRTYVYVTIYAYIALVVETPKNRWRIPNVEIEMQALPEKTPCIGEKGNEVQENKNKNKQTGVAKIARSAAVPVAVIKKPMLKCKCRIKEKEKTLVQSRTFVGKVRVTCAC